MSRLNRAERGVLAYELLTDNRILESSLQQLGRTGIVPRPGASEPTPPSRFRAAIPPALDSLVLRLVRRDPADRPGSAGEVCDTLAALEACAPAVQPGAGRSAAQSCAWATVPADTHAVGVRRSSQGVAERPGRCVVLSAYRIRLHPVTNAEHNAFLDMTGYRRPGLIDHPVLGLPDAPAVDVRWSGAAACAAWAAARLPTELEQEAAAKAGGPDAEFPWGAAEPFNTQANLGRILEHTSPVGSYPRSGTPGACGTCAATYGNDADPWDDALYRRSLDRFAATGRFGFRFKAERANAGPLARPATGTSSGSCTASPTTSSTAPASPSPSRSATCSPVSCCR